MGPGEVFVDVSREDLAYVRQLATAEGVQIEESNYRAFDPVSVVLIITGTALAVNTVTHAIERIKGGQIVDLRPAATTTFYRDKGLAYGLVTIIAADGTVTIELHEPKSSFAQVCEVLKDFLSDLTGLSILSIADKVVTLIGDRGAVRVRGQKSDAAERSAEN